MKRLFPPALLSLLTACASIIEGSDQPILVDTPGHACSRCSLSNERGSWEVGCTPETVTVQRSYSDMEVMCMNDQTGASAQTVIESDTEAWAFGNIALGGIIGAGVDMGTGAAYDYSDMNLSMTSPIPATPAEPVQSYSPAPAAPVQAQPAQPTYIPFGEPSKPLEPSEKR